MRDDSRVIAAGYVSAVVALVAWPARDGWSNWTVLVIFLAGLLVGSLLWVLLVERRLPWPLQRRERLPDPPGAAIVGFLAYSFGFLAFLIAETVWPMRGDMFLDPPVTTTTPDGSFTTVTYLTHFDIPENAARLAIVYGAVSSFSFVIGTALLPAIGSWLRRRLERRTQAV